MSELSKDAELIALSNLFKGKETCEKCGLIATRWHASSYTFKFCEVCELSKEQLERLGLTSAWYGSYPYEKLAIRHNKLLRGE